MGFSPSIFFPTYFHILPSSFKQVAFLQAYIIISNKCSVTDHSKYQSMKRRMRLNVLVRFENIEERI